MFAEPLTEREVVNATRSAEKAWEARGNKEADRIARSLGYPGAGYNISNKKLIKWLNLTAEEQQHLKTIIDWREKRKRDSRRLEREEAYRREAGDMPREEYIGQVKEQAKEQAKQRYQKAAELRANGLSQRQIAAILGVAQSTVCRWLKD
jgi:DNA-directed RNA polymerase specialized sigma subunit